MKKAYSLILGCVLGGAGIWKNFFPGMEVLVDTIFLPSVSLGGLTPVGTYSDNLHLLC